MTYLNDHDILLNWLPNNINKLFNLIQEAGLKEEDFTQDDERWAGDNYQMEESQRKALRIYWKGNPQYKFVWHEANRKTQTYFEPKENSPFKYNGHYPLHDHHGSVLVLGEVNREFRSWLEELKKRVIEEKKLASRNKNTESNNILNSKFFPDKSHFEASLELTKLIEQASQEIILIDNYIDQSTLKLLSSKKPTVSVRILTNKKALTDSVEVFAKNFQKQYGKLEIKTTETFHDRFIITDKNIFYQIGASIKDLGNKSFMFQKVEENISQQELLDKFNQEWNVSA
jgi:hypothetical protein